MTFNLCLIHANQDQICASETESRTLHKRELGGTSKQPPPSQVPLTNSHQLRTVTQEALKIPPICILDTATGWFQSMEAEETRAGIDING